MNIYGITKLNLLDNETKLFFENKEVQLLDGVHRFFSKPYNSEYQMWELTYPLFTNDEISVKLYQKEDPRKDALDRVVEITKSWDSPFFQNFVKETSIDDIIVHPLYDHIPTVDELQKIPKNVILIGDAIHPMSPFVGKGANEAIMDCYELVTLLNKTENLTTHLLTSTISTYYEQMIVRTTKSVQRSRENTEFYHSSEATDKFTLYNFKKWQKNEN
jgi:salicylate hydroxylase